MREVPSCITHTMVAGATDKSISVAINASGVCSYAILKEVRLHLNAAAGPAEADLVITLDSVSGAEHDCVLVQESMAGKSDAIVFPNNYLQRGDYLNCSFANTSGRTWGLKLFFQEI